MSISKKLKHYSLLRESFLSHLPIFLSHKSFILLPGFIASNKQKTRKHTCLHHQKFISISFDFDTYDNTSRAGITKNNKVIFKR